MRQAYPFTNADILLAANLDRGRLYRYSSISYCVHHDCLIDYKHIESCETFYVDNKPPSTWL